MKVRPGHSRGYGNLPLPIALLLSAAFFFAGYYLSITNQEVLYLSWLALFLFSAVDLKMDAFIPLAGH